MTTHNLVLHPEWIIPVVPRDTVLTDHSVVISDGEISALLPRTEAAALNDCEHVQLPRQVLLPGMVNSHGHSAMSLLRGYADDQPLMTWLNDHIWPTETKFVSEAFVADGVDIAIADLLLGGTTTFSDQYFFPNITAQRAEQAGIRAQLTFPVIDVPTAWAQTPEEYLEKGLALYHEYRHSERIDIGLGPHSNYTVSEETLKKVVTYAEELDIPVQIHLHETKGEVLMSVENLGERPIDQLARIGMLGPRTQCVHMTALAPEDIDTVQRFGAHVIHCPRSNMKLASGICPVQALLDRGINVALGTDGAASNNRLNMLNEMQTAALLAKLDKLEPTALSAMDALEMATLRGARALGYEDKLGSIEVGKQADLIALDMGRPATLPVNNLISQVVYATSGSELRWSWVNGQCLVREGSLTTINLDELRERADRWSATLADFAQSREQ